MPSRTAQWTQGACGPARQRSGIDQTVGVPQPRFT